MNQGPSEGSEISADEYLARRIQIYRVYFCRDPVFTCLKNGEDKNGSYKNRHCRGIIFLSGRIGRPIQLYSAPLAGLEHGAQKLLP